jgi:hypothetical protein
VDLTKTLRWLVVLVVGFALLIALFYGVEDFRGTRAWSKFKRAQAADGEKLNFADFVPPSVPDDQNFAMTPLLRPAFDYARTTNGIRWRDTNAWQHLSHIQIDLAPRGVGAPSINDLQQGSPVDLKAFADFYRGNTNYPQSAHPGTDAENVLTALNKFDPDLKELREAAATRPYSRFPMEYGYEPSAGILLPHLAIIRDVTLVCDLRAIAELETHHGDDAFADLQLGFRLSASIRDEPFLIDHLVRISTLNITLGGIREGLTRHAWSDSQLAAFENTLTNIDLLSEYEHTMRGERALNIGGIDYFRRHGLDNSLLADASSGTEGLGPLAKWMPSGWYYQNMVLIGQTYRDFILPAVDASNHVIVPALSEGVMADITQRQLGPYNVLAKLLLPALGKASQRAARGQTLVDESAVACAIERYRMQHNELPDTLDAITPQFISHIPHDLFSGQPLRYKKNDNGSYILYSIGWNLRDDGGKTSLTTGNKPHANPDEGDWVWEFPGK